MYSQGTWPRASEGLSVEGVELELNVPDFCIPATLNNKYLLHFHYMTG